jgi:hypothetical protein
VHNFGVGVVRASTTADTFKAALYFVNSSLGAATTVYSATGEVSGAGYSSSGTTITNATAPTTSGTTGYWTPSANIQWAGLTIASSFDASLVYNATQANKAVGVLTFPAQTISAGTFTITMPTNGPTSALLQLN